jgi:hypothetical protein
VSDWPSLLFNPPTFTFTALVSLVTDGASHNLLNLSMSKVANALKTSLSALSPLSHKISSPFGLMSPSLAAQWVSAVLGHRALTLSRTVIVPGDSPLQSDELLRLAGLVSADQKALNKAMTAVEFCNALCAEFGTETANTKALETIFRLAVRQHFMRQVFGSVYFVYLLFD